MMKLWIIVWLVGLLGFTSSAITSDVKNSLTITDDVPGDRGVLVGPRILDTIKDENSHEHETPEKCLPGEYSDEGECYECLEHDMECKKSRQCCGVENMSCWKYGYNAPMCKCDPDFAWNATSGECYPAPLPSVLLVTAYTALGAACVVGICAIVVHACTCFKDRYSRRRYGHDSGSAHREQFRGRRRREAPRPPRERRLSSIAPRPNSEPMTEKPPNYEDVYGMPTLSQALQRNPNGSIRSLPPAYTPREDDLQDTESKTSQVNDPSGNNNQSEVFQNTEQVPSEGVINPAFTTEQHI